MTNDDFLQALGASVIEPEDIKKRVLEKLDDRDGTNYSRVSDGIDSLLEMFFPERTYTSEESEKMYNIIDMLFEFTIYSSIKATFEVMNDAFLKPDKEK